MINPAMRNHLLQPYRHMAWLAWFEPDLYVWSGSHHMTYDGNLYLGYGYLTRIESMRKGGNTQHVEQVFELNGINPAILAELDTSVRGRAATVWLAGIGQDRQVITEPVVERELIQDTLGWEYATDGTVKLRLTCYDALPLLGKATRGKWSYEGQIKDYPSPEDVGFKYNAAIALTGAAIAWTMA